MADKKKIVIVEDEKDILELLNIMLTRVGYEVFLCDNGRYALDLIKKTQPDLVLLDMMLPGMDGKAIAAQLAENEDTSKIPIMITSALEESAKIFVGNPQIKDYCFKPFKMATLLEKVKNITGG
jgi:DNA-binding response OmpR family regulator